MISQVGSFTWDEKAYSRYESFWSLLHKLAHWNYLRSTEILDAFGRCQGKGSILGHSLLIKQYLDVRRICQSLGISERSLQEGFLDHYILEREMDYLAARTLRFCPDCIRTGYHSILHQFLFLDRCPYHLKLLERICPACSRPIEVNYSGLALEYCYSCPSCTQSLRPNWKDKDPQEDAHQRTEAFERVAIVMLARKVRTPVTMSSMIWTSGYGDKDYISNLMAQLWSAWMKIYGSRIQSRSYVPHSGLSIAIRTKKHGSEQPFDLTSMYVRHLIRKILPRLGEHVQCVQIAAREGWWMVAGMSLEKVTICPLAQAYFLWRMYWEGRGSAHGLFLPNTGQAQEGVVNRVFWTQPSLGGSFWAKRKIFELECTGTFLSALQTAHSQYEQKMVFYPGKALSLHCIPYWELCQWPEDNVELFWHLEISSTRKVDNVQYTTSHLKSVEDDLDRASAIFSKQILRYHPRG